MKKELWSLVGATALVLSSPPAQASDLLEERLRDVEERLRRQEEQLANVSSDKGARPETLRAYWKEGLRFDTADKAFRFKIGGRVHSDWAVITEDDEIKAAVENLENGTEFRRARLYLAGVIYERVEFKFQYDFAGGDADFKDVYVGLTGLPFVGGVRVGQFKEPFSLEELTSANYITFMERALPNTFAPSRSTGLMIHNQAASDRLTWALGTFLDSNEFGNQSGDGEFSFTGRLTGLPWYREDGRHLLHLGLGYSYRNPNDDGVRLRQRPEAHLVSPFVNTGTLATESLQLVGVEAAVVCGPASLQGEYIHSTADTPGGDPDFTGLYIYGSYFLTGENRSYNTSKGAFDKVRPKRNFLYGDNAGPGAWEVAARYSHLDLNDAGVSGGRLDDFTLGLNWYLNPNTRVMANYVFADLNNVGEAHIGQMRFQLFF